MSPRRYVALVLVIAGVVWWLVNKQFGEGTDHLALRRRPRVDADRPALFRGMGDRTGSLGAILYTRRGQELGPGGELTEARDTAAAAA